MHEMSSQNRAMGINRVALNPVWYPACHSKKAVMVPAGSLGRMEFILGTSGAHQSLS